MLAVGGFRHVLPFLVCVKTTDCGSSIYHFNALMKNTTTIEGWEKDKVATLVRRGKIQEVLLFF